MTAAQGATAMLNGPNVSSVGPYNQSSTSQAYFADTTGALPAMDVSQEAGAGPVDSTPIEHRGIMGKPATWWVMLVLVTAIFIFISRRAGGPEKFGNIKLTIWNALFSVAWIIIVLNFMKVVFSYLKVPGWSELVAAA